MSKPQFAAEPSMEDILSSIRRMISDDRPGPNPIPDQMGRTPFGGSSPAASGAGDAPRGQASVSPLAPVPSFSSLSDALKAATATSDQRRHLQQEIAEVLEKGPPRGRRPDLSTFAPATPNSAPARSGSNHAAIAPQSQRAALDGPHTLPGGGNPSAAETTGSDYQSFDFGTHVPQRDAYGNAPAGDPTPSPEAPQVGQQRIELPKSEGQRIVAMPSRTPGMNGATVAPFPRVVRESAKAGAAVEEPWDKQPSGTRDDAAGRAPSDGNTTASTELPQPAASAPAEQSKSGAGAAQSVPSEALVDAMVELVKNEPQSLSVFTSGMAFIKGVSDKGIGVAQSVAAHKKGESTLPAGAARKDDGPPELDGAAAELLRPMLRQWLSENMPRIVEAALRSEISSGGKGPKG